MKKASLKPTRKEIIVLELVSEGLSNIEIAQKMQLSQRTVGSHIQNLFIKTGCNSRFTLVLHFIRAGKLKPIGTTDRIKELEQQVAQLQKERTETIAQLEELKSKSGELISRVLDQLVG